MRERCPRLWRALCQARAEIAAWRHAEAEWVGEVLRLERLVAHRELQLARACGWRQGDYWAVRARKLREAQQALARVRRRRPMRAVHSARSADV